MHREPLSGSAVGNADWTGVMLRTLLRACWCQFQGGGGAAVRGVDGIYTGVLANEIMREETG